MKNRKNKPLLNRDSLEYEELRLGYNGACRNLFPKVILRPETTEDVAVAVKAANKLGLKVTITGILYFRL